MIHSRISCIYSRLQSYAVVVLFTVHLLPLHLPAVSAVWNSLTRYHYLSSERRVFFCPSKSNSGPDSLVFYVSTSHTIRHTHTPVRTPLNEISSSQRPLPTQQATNTTGEHLCPQWDSKPWSQKSSGCRPTPCTRTFIGIEIAATAVFYELHPHFFLPPINPYPTNVENRVSS